jgi:glucan phosphoethanolaminetransferase (alkaline phosphatase superfamily)
MSESNKKTEKKEEEVVRKENSMDVMKRDDIKSLLKTKQQIEKNKNLVQPTAIDEKLILEYMKQFLREEKIYDMEKM